MNSKKFELFVIIIIVAAIIIIIGLVAYVSVEINKTRTYRQYNEAELDSAVTYLGLEKCTIIEGTPYFNYGNKKHKVIAFAEAKKGKK